jgi:ABC-type uncharacterized transport system substrate-binding protein
MRANVPKIAAPVAVAILGFLATCFSAGATEPTKVFRVGIVSGVVPRSAPHWAAFEQRLRDLGYVEGQNLAIDFLSLGAKTERYSAAMQELVRRNVDVIVAPGVEIALKAAKQATDNIPVVMVAIDFDPLALGYFPSLARPGGNVTGVFLRQIELTGKRLDLLKQTIPVCPGRWCSGTPNRRISSRRRYRLRNR